MAKNDYKNWAKEELVKEVERLQKRKKYGLVWKDTPEDAMEQCKNELQVFIRKCGNPCYSGKKW